MKYTKLADVDFYEIGVEEARNLAPVCAKDRAVTVHCNGKAEHWNSRAVCAEFHRLASVCCDGSEAARYADIYFGCISGDEIPTDGMPIIRKPKNNKPLTEAEKKELAALMAKEKVVIAELEAIREKNLNSGDNELDKREGELVSTWNDIALKVCELALREHRS